MDVLRTWLSGEKSLPEAVRNWADDNSRLELASFAAYFVVQAVVGSLLVSATIRISMLLASAFESVPPSTTVGIVLLAVLTVEVPILLSGVRTVARCVETLAEQPEDGPGNAGTVEGK